MNPAAVPDARVVGWVPVRVQVVIVNYRSADLTLGALASLAPERARHPDLRVTVVENDSRDGSLERLQQALASGPLSDWVRLVGMPSNRGFAHGVNAGVLPALSGPNPPDAFLLLNPDTIVRPGALDALAEFLDQHPAAGIAGSRLEDEDGTQQHSSFRFPGFWSELDSGLRVGLVTRLLHRHVISEPLSEVAHRTAWVAGASALVRREVFERIGPMDDGFFLYYEETDFMRRAAAAGFECWYVPSSRVVHLVGRSTGVTTRGARPGRRPAYWFDSRRRYFRKHHGLAGALALDAVFFCCYTTWCLRNLVARKPTIDPPCFWRDFAAHQFLPACMRPAAPRT